MNHAQSGTQRDVRRFSHVTQNSMTFIHFMSKIFHLVFSDLVELKTSGRREEEDEEEEGGGRGGQRRRRRSSRKGKQIPTFLRPEYSPSTCT